MKAFIYLGLFLMLILLLCWYLVFIARFTITLNNVYGFIAPELSPRLLLVQTQVEESSSYSNVPIASQDQTEIGESPVSPQQERPLVDKISGDDELLVCQVQNDQLQHQQSQPVLPQYVIDHVKTLVFFLGHAHSGHSIVASLMDSHPHMVISHELDLVAKLSLGIIAPNKAEIFNTIWSNTVQTAIDGVRTHNGKGYNLTVDGLCEGSYSNTIDVIGDKRGGKTVSLLNNNNSKRWLTAFTILKSLNVTLKVILVLRNPYDVIASTILLDRYIYRRKYSETKYANYKKNNTTIEFSPDLFNSCIHQYFKSLRLIMDGQKKYNLDIIEIHGKDLILDPRGTLLKLCGSLGVICSDNYLDICSNKIYKTESRTRHLVNWTNEGLQMVQQNIEKYSLLKEYTFDSM